MILLLLLLSPFIFVFIYVAATLLFEDDDKEWQRRFNEAKEKLEKEQP